MLEGLGIQYLLGLYFIVVSLSWSGNGITWDRVRLFFGLLFTITAILGLTLLGR